MDEETIQKYIRMRDYPPSVVGTNCQPITTHHRKIWTKEEDTLIQVWHSMGILPKNMEKMLDNDKDNLKISNRLQELKKQIKK